MIIKKIAYILFILSIFIVSMCLFIAIYSAGDKSTTSYLKGSGSYWDVDLSPNASTSIHYENINKST